MSQEKMSLEYMSFRNKRRTINNSFVEIIESKIDTNAVINGIIKCPAIFSIRY